MTTKANGKKTNGKAKVENTNKSKTKDQKTVIALEVAPKEEIEIVNVSQEEPKIIPKSVWKEFFEYWDSTEYEELDAKRIKELLDKCLFVPLPKDVRNRKAIDDWFSKLKEMREKGKPFGGITVNFSGQKATLEEVFGNKPLKITEMTKQLHFFINDNHLSSKDSEQKPETKPEENNGKKTVTVNSIEAMEKAVETIKPKKGKK